MTSTIGSENVVADHIFSRIGENVRKTSNIFAEGTNRKTNRNISIFRCETAIQRNSLSPSCASIDSDSRAFNTIFMAARERYSGS